METQMEEPQTSEDIKASLIQQMQNKREERESSGVNQDTETESDQETESDVIEHEGSGVEVEAEDLGETQEKGKTFTFQLGEEEIEIDENAIFTLKADGKPVQMTLKEMRDSAAGGVAVRNRMRMLADEKKKLYTPYKDFSKLADSDPLSALKKVFGVIKGIDPQADLNKFLVGLGKQAQNLTQMSPSERKAYELEQELTETRSNLTETERLAQVKERTQVLKSELGLSEKEIYSFGQQLLSDPNLGPTIQNEQDLFDGIEDLGDEIQRQKAVITALHKVDDKISNTDPLVFELSTLLSQNPDFDEQDLNEIVQGVLNGVKRSRASQVLSKRPRSNVLKAKANRAPDYSKLPPKESLMAQILDKKKSQQMR